MVENYIQKKKKMEKVHCKGEREKKNLYCKHLLRKTNLGKIEDLAITSLIFLKLRVLFGDFSSSPT